MPMNRKAQREQFDDAARRCGLFATDDAALEELAGIAMCHDYPKNNVLLYAGDPARAVFLVMSGAVKVSLMNEEAKEVVIGIERTGGLVGLVPLIDGGGQPANAVTIAPSRLGRFNGTELLSWVEARPEVASALRRGLASAVRQAYQKIGEHALLSVKERLLYTLLEIAEQEGELGPEGAWIFTRPTHQELADRIGSSREVVSRLLKELLESELLEAE